MSIEKLAEERLAFAFEDGDYEMDHEFDGIIDEVLSAYCNLRQIRVGGHVAGTPVYISIICDHIQRTVFEYMSSPDYDGRGMMIAAIEELLGAVKGNLPVTRS